MVPRVSTLGGYIFEYQKKALQIPQVFGPM